MIYIEPRASGSHLCGHGRAQDNSHREKLRGTVDLAPHTIDLAIDFFAVHLRDNASEHVQNGSLFCVDVFDEVTWL
jgi:hypothetical protein